VKAALVVSSLIAAAGCDDFATPAELAAPRIIALTSEPAAVEAGAEAIIDAVVAGPDGVIATRAAWSLETPVDGVTLFDDGADHIAVAAEVAETTVTLRAEVEVDGVRLVGIRALSVGGVSRANPTIDLRLDGAAAGPDLTLPLADEIEIAVVADPPTIDDGGDGDGGAVSWFATEGEIELYRRNPAVLETPDVSGTGMLLAVYRDGLGGVAWQQWTVEFQ
jgi:hypothetical protein